MPKIEIEKQSDKSKKQTSSEASSEYYTESARLREKQEAERNI